MELRVLHGGGDVVGHQPKQMKLVLRGQCSRVAGRHTQDADHAVSGSAKREGVEGAVALGDDGPASESGIPWQIVREDGLG